MTVILICIATIMTFAYIEKVIQLDRCQADNTNKLDEQSSKYRALYKNVEQAHGYCEARRMARQRGEYEAQMFSIESTTTAPKGEKSIEVF